MLLSRAAIGVLAFLVFAFVRVGVEKGVSKRNAGVFENEGVSKETGSSTFAMGREF